MLRKITSMTTFLSFIATLITSVVLYFTPEGRIAHWAVWHFWGLTKEQWSSVHITVGFLFLAAGLIHLWLNWKPIMAYMKNKAREMVVFTPAMIVAAALTLFFFVGTLLHWPPMKQIVELNEWFKAEAVVTYGNPPYGHAELSSLAILCKRMGFDPAKAQAALTAAGIKMQNQKQTLGDIATANNMTPKHLYEIITKARAQGDPFKGLPVTPPDGLGKMKFGDICAAYGLDLDAALARLRASGFRAGPEMTMRQIADEAGKQPSEVYQALIKDQGTENEAAPTPTSGQGLGLGQGQGLGQGPGQGLGVNRQPLPAGQVPQGLGRMTLSEACAAGNLDMDTAVGILRRMNVDASPDARMRDLAAQAGVTPYELFETLKK